MIMYDGTLPLYNELGEKTTKKNTVEYCRILLNKAADTRALLNTPHSEFLMIAFLSVISCFDESNICIFIVVVVL